MARTAAGLFVSAHTSFWPVGLAEHSMPDDDSTALIEHCTCFASQHGVDAMLDLLAGVYQAYAPISRDQAIMAVCDLADLDDVEIEFVTVQ